MSTLIKDFQSWRQHHIPRSFFSLFIRRKGKSRNYHHYIQWLEHRDKLDNYLDRSISYIFMRDLGKVLDSPSTQRRIQSVVDSLKKELRSDSTMEAYSLAGLYRMAQKEGVESSFIWVIDKIREIASHIPEGMDKDEVQRKLIKIIAGVVMQQVEELDEEISSAERARKLDTAIRLGYSYGLTYPFIDDILDSNILSTNERVQYSDMIRTTLITGTVPELGEWNENNRKLIRFIHSELRAAFEYIKTCHNGTTWKSFLEQSYVFFKSQEVDREKVLSIRDYTNEDLFIPVILKSASSRLIVRSLMSSPEDEEIFQRTFYYGIYNQLSDDFSDMYSDMEKGAVTPYTYYLKYHHERSDLINPFHLYWTVICYLIHQVYRSDAKTREVILDRAINGLKRFKARAGTKKYNEVMGIFSSGHPEFHRVIQQLVRKADDVDFFDKLLRDHMIVTFKKEREEREEFVRTARTVREQINRFLTISEGDKGSLLNDRIIDAANFSVGDGKRLRPILTWMMGIKRYGFEESTIVPLLKSLEYMHTASLILDDLPSQDNSPIRRGRPTIHEIHNVAVAELTGLFLTQKAVEEQASLKAFDSKKVLHLIRYSAGITADMCRGQAMDLGSKGKLLSLEQLNTMCFYKTGIGFEAAFIMPAILAGASDEEMDVFRKISYHAGIAFQIKDDLLDVEGDRELLGKPIHKDARNNTSNYVSILGQEGAKKAMWEHYCHAMEALREVPEGFPFLKHVLNYFVHRNY